MREVSTSSWLLVLLQVKAADGAWAPKRCSGGCVGQAATAAASSELGQRRCDTAYPAPAPAPAPAPSSAAARNQPAPHFRGSALPSPVSVNETR